MNPRSFFSELKRRNVYKVAITYAVVAWLLVQVGSILFPTFEVPSWVMKVYVTAIAVGFPVALVMAWAFELTPQGLKRTEVADAAQEHSARGGWIAVIVITTALSLGLFLLGRYTAQYQSKPANPGEIGKQLGVAHLLEGSVQKVGEQVRVNVQLINAQNDAHVWADTYDRKLTDIFAVETEIAKSIAEQLQARLTGHEQEALALKPTSNPEAYDAYLRGLAAESESLLTVYPFQKAISFYKRAIKLDPDFAIAWARLSRMYSLLYGSFGDRLGDAKGALERAQALQPNAPETLLALGYYQNDELREYDHARKTFLRVATLLPGNSEVPASLASISRPGSANPAR